MATTIHGRVLGVNNTLSGLSIDILTAGIRRRFLVAPIAPLIVGDLVSAECDAGGALQHIIVHARPGPRILDGDSDVVRWDCAVSGWSRRQRLVARQRVCGAIRRYFDRNGFLEVQIPLLLPSTCPDVAIESFSTASGEYLTTSTEYQIKRMLVGGFEHLYTLTQNWRAGDLGTHHNPEFTMLEWARAYETLDAIEADAEAFVREAAAVLLDGRDRIEYQGHTIALGTAWRRLSVRDALRETLGADVDEEFSLQSMQQAVAQACLRTSPRNQTDRRDLISLLLIEAQPRLGVDVPVFLRDWPAFMTSSAGIRADNPHIAERSELYIAGLEISDGFPFLRDATVQRRHFEREVQLRRQSQQAVPILDEKYTAALDAGIPPGAGMALGVDRLVMILTDAPTIRDVIPFAWDER